MFDNFTTKGTQLMAIYKNHVPYFYIIQDIRNGMYYAGAKWAQGCHPEQLLKEGGYPTSSETIKELIRQHGLDSFIIRKIRTFKSSDEAYKYEKRFLVKVDARNHPRFYNGHNNDGAMDHKKMKAVYMELYGVDHIMKFPGTVEKVNKTKKARYGDENYNNREKAKKTSLDKLGVDHHMKDNKSKEKFRDSMNENYGVSYAMQSEELRKIHEDSLYKNHGVRHNSQISEVKENKKKTMNENYGVSYAMQSEELRKRHEDSLYKNHGVKYVWEIPEVKEKKKKAISNKVNRSIVFRLRELSEKYKVKLGNNWSRKSDEWIISKIDEIEKTYKQ